MVSTSHGTGSAGAASAVDGASGARTTAQADAAPGTLLMQEALDHLDQRRWRPALTVLESARHLRPNDPAVDELTLIAAAHGRRIRALAESRRRILDRPEQTASGYHALAVAALAGDDFAGADSYARRAIALDPDSPAGWADLATSFAGLGWFDESTECLTSAADLGGLAPLQQWRLGRAVNHWAMAQNRALLFTAIATVLAGMLALAVGLSIPIALREIRVGRLPEPFKGAAEWHWRTEHRTKILHGLGVLIAVVGFAASQYYLATT